MGDERLVHHSEIEWTDYEHGDRTFRRKQLGAAAGGEDLGCSLYEVPPGKRTWPPHYHTGNEEAVYVLAGTGTLRLGAGGDARERPLEPGVYAALPRGEEASTHEIHNTGDEPLRVLVVSTMNEPDITIFPDTGKVGLFAGSAPGGDRDERTLSKTLDGNAEVPYWDE